MRYLLTILMVLPAFADFNRTSDLIDIPGAHVLPHLGYRVGFDGSIGISDDLGFDKNVHTALGVANCLEFYFDVYTFSGAPTIGFGLCHNFYNRKNLAVSWGIHDVSYAKDISEVGHGDSIGWYDDLSYTSGDYTKPFELISAFLTSTYSLNRSINLTFGMGRGKFVGYGDHSKFLNSNVHHSAGGDWGIGLFGGIDVTPFNNFTLMLEIDGRDFSAGMAYRYKPIKMSLAFTKIEHLIWGSETYGPRVSFALSYIKDPEVPRFGKISGTVFDQHGSSIAAEVGFFEKNIPPAMTKTELGTFLFIDLDPGTYEVYATAKGFKGKTKKIKVSAGKTVYCDFELGTEHILGGIFGKIFDIKTNEPILASVSIPQISRSVASDAIGMFELKDLASDLYQVVIDADGYETGYYQVTVNAADKTQFDIAMLKPGMNIIFEGIEFDFNKATMKLESEIILNDAAAILTNHPDIKVEIQGHTDSVGGATYNFELSNARANEVRNYLIKNRNIDSSRLIARGYGEQNPIASNLTEKGRTQNRRVEFLILK